MALADCHIHVFDGGLFPFPPDAVFNPGPALGTRGGLTAVAEAHGTTHALVVNAFRGSDHRQFLDVLRWGRGALRGIATLEPDVSDEELNRFEAAGTVGQRFDLATVDMNALTAPAGRRFLARLAERDWLAELQMNAKSPPDLLLALIDLLREAGLAMVIGHYSQPNPEMPLDQPIFATMMRLAEIDTTIVKLSSFFRHSRAGLPYGDLDPFLEKVIAAYGPSRCVWGSDWPFTRFPRHVAYGEELACIARWIADPAERERILWDNPSRVFGFKAEHALTGAAQPPA